jgi:hypothetical protein
MAKALLVIGIHREELAFGRAVAAQLDPAHIDVLEIPEGLPGRHPRPDQRFQHDKLHRELYLQLLPRIRHYPLLIDLHAGLDEVGQCADLYSRDPARLAAYLQAPQPRLIQLGDADDHYPYGKTIIPPEVWQSPDCLYVGLEIYLKKVGAGETAEQDYARALIAALAQTADSALAVC